MSVGKVYASMDSLFMLSCSSETPLMKIRVKIAQQFLNYFGELCMQVAEQDLVIISTECHELRDGGWERLKPQHFMYRFHYTEDKIYKWCKKFINTKIPNVKFES